MLLLWNNTNNSNNDNGSNISADSSFLTERAGELMSCLIAAYKVCRCVRMCGACVL